jgi:hypothetical protein
MTAVLHDVRTRLHTRCVQNRFQVIEGDHQGIIKCVLESEKRLVAHKLVSHKFCLARYTYCCESSRNLYIVHRPPRSFKRFAPVILWHNWRSLALSITCGNGFVTCRYSPKYKLQMVLLWPFLHMFSQRYAEGWHH